MCQDAPPGGHLFGRLHDRRRERQDRVLLGHHEGLNGLNVGEWRGEWLWRRGGVAWGGGTVVVAGVWVEMGKGMGMREWCGLTLVGLVESERAEAGRGSIPAEVT